MPRFSPFPGIRYDLAQVDLAEVSAPPYDVIDADGRAALLARHPANIVQVDLPVGGAAEAGTGAAEADLEAGADPYAGAAATLEGWLADGTMVRDEPTFYVYRMEHTDEAGVPRRTTGVMGALALSRPGEDGILPHEQTTKKAKSDRLDLQRATGTNMSAVWGLSPAAGLSDLLDRPGAPAARWTDPDGVAHSLWLVTDAADQEAIAAAVASAPVVIADGHHRYETALNHRDELTAAGHEVGGADAFLCLVVEMADDELTVKPIHRLISGLDDPSALPDLLAGSFEVSDAGPTADLDAGVVAIMQDTGRLVLVGPERSWFLAPRPEAFTGVRDLDTSRLDHALAAVPPHSLVFQHGVGNVVRRVTSGEQQVGVLVRPATVDQIVAIAHGGERMPPKTTFFHPKPATGVVIRPLR